MKNGLVVDEDGTRIWYKDALPHRDGGPAIELCDGSVGWYLNGKKHRVDGPAMIWEDGTELWFLNDKKHRVDGPAEIWTELGSEIWWLNDKKHRVDGPAVEYNDGTNYWWLNGEELIHPEKFLDMKEWIAYLNCNEEESYQLIHDINGFIGLIDNPSDKQVRVHQMAHVI